jgi:hypothetical protein
MKSTAAISLIATGGAGLIYGTFLFLVRLDVVSPEVLRFASVAILLWVSVVILVAGVVFLIRKQGGSSNGPT